MSDSSSLPTPDSGRPEPRGAFWVTLLAALGCFVIFLVVLFVAYIPQRRTAPEVDLAKIPPEEQWKYTPAGRRAHLDEMRAREKAAATSYAWIDRNKGIVQLPLDRAVELTLQELNSAAAARVNADRKP
ncbi:MAG: hypothetical protein WC485_03720 [Opitutaceae bacterium]